VHGQGSLAGMAHVEIAGGISTFGQNLNSRTANHDGQKCRFCAFFYFPAVIK
jgi:hypothetical protein